MGENNWSTLSGMFIVQAIIVQAINSKLNPYAAIQYKDPKIKKKYLAPTFLTLLNIIMIIETFLVFL